MGTYKVKGPGGRTVTLRGDTPPTESDLDQIFASIPPVAVKEKPSQIKGIELAGPIARGSQAAQRGAQWKDVPGLVTQTAQAFGGDTPESVAKRPLKTAMGLPVAVGRAVEGAKTEEPNQIPFPHAVTEEGKLLESQLKGIGYASGAIEAYPLIKNAYNLARVVKAGGPKGLLKKAQDLTFQLLQPTKNTGVVSAQKGVEVPAVEEATKVIGKSKNYEEIAQQVKTAKKANMRQRNEILRANNYDIGEEYLIPLLDEINDLKRKPQTKSIQAEIAQMEDALNAEREWLSKNRLTRVKAQARKEWLQRETQNLLKRAAKGEMVQTLPGATKADDRIRYGLMKTVEGGNEVVRNLNRTYEGLNEAEKLAHGQAVLARKAQKPSLVQRIPIVGPMVRMMYGRPDIATAEWLGQMAQRRQTSIPKQTKKIGEYMSLYEQYSPKNEGLPSNARIVPRLTGPEAPKSLGQARMAGLLEADPNTGEGFVRNTREQAQEAINLAKFKEGFEYPVVGPRKKVSGQNLSTPLREALAKILFRRGL